MAIASGWRREDAVVSEATRRLEEWVARGPWRARAVEEGAPSLAVAVAKLLDARAVLVLVRGEGGEESIEGSTWRPVAWARAAGRYIAATSIAVDEDGAEAALGTLTASLGSTPPGPLMRDEWDEGQAAFAARAALFAREVDAPAGAASANPAGIGPGFVQDSENSLADFHASEEGALAPAAVILNEDEPEVPAGPPEWLGEAPSLLLPLPASSSAEHSGRGALCGVAVAWIESEDGLLSDEWKLMWSACASQAGAWLESALRFERVGRSYRDLAQLAARAVDSREARRAGHGPLVAHACVLMARALGLGEREVEEWEIAGLLHGVGRVGIPDALLLKEGALSPEEREVIRSAMQQGASWLGEVEGWEGVARLARHAGERWDGAGYPDGLEGDAIPLGSRALAIANRFASLAQGRPDRGALGSLRNVGAALESEAGRALDPQLVALFLAALRGGTR